MTMITRLWYFWLYSFGGWILERSFAALTQAEDQKRRCLLLLPFCPVYGLGMLAVLTLPDSIRGNFRLIFFGGLVATGTEYLYHWCGEYFLGVRFWDYSHVSGNLDGRICWPFSFIWGILTALAVWWVQPVFDWLILQIPALLSWCMLMLFTADLFFSIRFLFMTHDIAALRNVWTQIYLSE